MSSKHSAHCGNVTPSGSGMPQLAHTLARRATELAIARAGAIAITRGVSAVGGATDQCRDNLRAAWPLLEEAGKTAAGRLLLTEAVGACEALRYAGDLPGWAQRPYFFMAEGNYPVK